MGAAWTSAIFLSVILILVLVAQFGAGNRKLASQ